MGTADKKGRRRLFHNIAAFLGAAGVLKWTGTAQRIFRFMHIQLHESQYGTRDNPTFLIKYALPKHKVETVCNKELPIIEAWNIKARKWLQDMEKTEAYVADMEQSLKDSKPEERPPPVSKQQMQKKVRRVSSIVSRSVVRRSQ
ncbi:MAG: hypothetical protein QF486_05330 [Candidatus Woesearchaeota archaeon]|jgi:hypothetical protein|nr:hypothetical protein [Candidatus Woesearchaeota archaeon]MDP7199010.1 hypothetical protein [Candidatus Woesearchaeota archaeon]MDP7467736.1 hypothetical protein [Candidatus Woesearchaeota archaeon]MDP7646820.1 hypothetical protein [Candidatus Woesearchaeota archaeon]